MNALSQQPDPNGLPRKLEQGERILVCVGPAPASDRLVRTAGLIAAGLRAPWVAAYVESDALGSDGDAARARLDAHLQLAESLGASVVRLSGQRVSSTLLTYAREHGITRIVLGKPTHSRLRDLTRGSLLDEVVRGSGDLEVHVVSGCAPAHQGSVAPVPKGAVAWSAYGWASGIVALSTMAAWLARALLAAPDIVLLYLVAIAIVAVRFGRAASLLASALSVGAYDFFFVPPLFAFTVLDERHILTFAAMFAVSLFISALMSRIQRQERAARDREARTGALYSLSRELSTALHEAHAAEVLARHAADVVHGPAAVVMPQQGAPAVIASVGEVPFDDAERAVAQSVLTSGRLAGRGTASLPDARITCLPIHASERALGALVLSPGLGQGLDVEARHLLEAYARQGGLALERARLAELAKAAALKAHTEEMRSSLLSTVSHDLRTPLAAIMAAGSALRHRCGCVASADQEVLVDAICEEAARLDRLVGNLLDMTRVECGGLNLRCEWVPLEEIVYCALSRLERHIEGRSVRVALPDSLPLLSVDPVLFEQVFINLFENAAKYTPPGSPIEVTAAMHGSIMEIEVCDRGPGLPQNIETVFEKFSRGQHPGVAGAGLGLAICRGLIEAHSGTLSAENRTAGGAAFRITLPMRGVAPTVPAELPDALDAQEGRL